MNEDPCIDEAALTKLRELGDNAFVVEMIDAFFSLVRKSNAEARAGLETGNLDPVIRMGHSLTSSARIIGARSLQDIAVRVERQARGKHTQELPGLLDEFDRAYLLVKERLDVIRASLVSP